MAGLRGPDSSKDAQLLDERAVFPETVDVNIRQLDPIPAPRYFLKELPLTNEMSDLVLKSRQEIRDVLHGRDDRRWPSSARVRFMIRRLRTSMRRGLPPSRRSLMIVWSSSCACISRSRAPRSVGRV